MPSISVPEAMSGDRGIPVERPRILLGREAQPFAARDQHPIPGHDFSTPSSNAAAGNKCSKLSISSMSSTPPASKRNCSEKVTPLT